MAIAQTKRGRRKRVSPGTKGAISEHLATAWLLSNGFDVFRNVSPNGRADLLAVDWENDKTIRVDVKSDGFSLSGNGAKVATAKERDELNSGFDIRYLVVKPDGDCEWYEESGEPSPDNDNESPQWWIETKTRQRFPMPGNDMSKKEWSYFCHWSQTNYPDLIPPFSESFIRDMSVRGRSGYIKHTAGKEIAVLKRFLSHIHDRLSEMGLVEYKRAIS